MDTVFKNSDNYQEERIIGTGAYGTVYKATDKVNNMPVALKKVRVPLTENGIPMSTLREIAHLKRLGAYDHPNIVRLLDICHGKRLPEENVLIMFLVFEYLHQDLASYISKYHSRCLMGSRRIREISKQILCGVDFLHSHRIIHRDLKPQNILVKENGHIKLADFGLAKTYDFEMKLTSVVVTLWYRAPEVLLGLPYATAVDIWSVGCIIAELYKLRPIFCGTSESDQLCKIFKILGRPAEDDWPKDVSIEYTSFPVSDSLKIKDILPNLCENGYDVIMKMLTFTPSKRISALAALQHIYFTEEYVDT